MISGKAQRDALNNQWFKDCLTALHLAVLSAAASEPYLPPSGTRVISFSYVLRYWSSSARARGSGGDTVQGLYDTLLGTMKNGPSLGQSGRFACLEPVIRRTFDIPTMASLSVGSSWATLAEAQRQQVIESFGRYISAIYADRFDSYAGQKLQVTGERPVTAGLMVKSQIIKANGEPVNVDYMMRRNGDTWLISDIYLDGSDRRGGEPPLRIRGYSQERRYQRADCGDEPQSQYPQC
jgi:hopanoid biosynthesis associated membrane protein HpnM